MNRSKNDSKRHVCVRMIVDAEEWNVVSAWSTQAFWEHVLCVVLETASPKTENADVGLVLSDDVVVQDHNSRYRGKDAPTNVLAFPISTEGWPRHLSQHLPLGDVLLSWTTLSREANEMGIDLREHVVHMVVHGFLHLLGYDHHDEEEAKDMESYEDRCLSTLGFSET